MSGRLFPGSIKTTSNDQGLSVVDMPHRWFVIYFNNECSAPAAYDVEVVLQAGVVGKNQCWHKSAKLTTVVPTPGEITVFWDSLNFFERLKHTRDAW